MTSPSWFVTGASTGIGRAVTEQLPARGHRVAAPVRRTERPAELADTHPGLQAHQRPVPHSKPLDGVHRVLTNLRLVIEDPDFMPADIPTHFRSDGPVLVGWPERVAALRPADENQPMASARYVSLPT
ncbi:hypothetical protein [Streptosporangium subroseum]|uniref:hypothetical protein n=1 Tax=Streptosporangium subroseum TaxID=106412 RepID=UPI00308D4628|nr:hypothetical protein OHB15_26450 [Streptosporangium subroseum]